MNKLLTISLAICLSASPLWSQSTAFKPPTAAEKAKWAADDAADIAAFDRRASQTRGAVSITAGLPPATWQFDYPDDPYPAWFIGQASIMKLFPPKELAPFVPKDYTERVQKILAARSAVLQKYNLRASWSSCEPQVLPEAFFLAYPELRGPRVDQPNRSRVARFAPCVDEPETLRLYREAMKSLLAACPTVSSFSFLTSDSGSGFDWVPGLYPGINGNTRWKDRPMEDRVAGFLINLQQAAKEAGHDITVSVNPIGPRQWMTASFSPEVLAAIREKLPAGLSVGGRGGGGAGGARGGRGGRGGNQQPAEVPDDNNAAGVQ